MPSSLPEELLFHIIQFVSLHGYRPLLCLASTNRLFRDAVYNTSILRDIDLSDFIINGGRLRVGSAYRPFIQRCVFARNPVACLMEGLRIAFTESDLDRGIAMIQSCTQTSVYGIYAMGFVNILRGEHELGLRILNDMRWWEDIPSATLVGQTVMQSIRDMNPPLDGVNGLRSLGLTATECDCDVFLVCCVECFISDHSIAMWFLT